MNRAAEAIRQSLFPILLSLLVYGLSSCSVMRLPEAMSKGILNNQDLDIVGEALPTYIVMLDGLMLNYPKNKNILLTSAQLNSAYASLFAEDPVQQARQSDRALTLSLRAMCLSDDDACQLRKMPFEEFEKWLAGQSSAKHLPLLYSVASVWAGYIQINSADWNAIAELARVQRMMEKIVSVDPKFEFGMPLLYLGVLNSLVPPALGGKPEVAKDYFEKALKVSERRNLLVQVYYAQQYARMIFDRELHDALLREVLAAEPEKDGFTLQNVYAQAEAKKLLAESAEYFD